MIDMDKKYTFKGMSGKVVMVDRKCSSFPVLWVRDDGDIWTFTSDGRRYVGGTVRLIEVKPTRWVNVYPSYVGGPYDSRVMADENAGVTRIACVEVTEGDGI